MPWIAGKIKNLGTKAFSWAVYQGHLGMLDLGVTLCRPKMSAPLSDYDEMLPCHLAAKRGHLQVLIRLKAIEGLSRPMPCPRTGRGEIHYAAEQDQSAIVDFLVQSDPSLILSKGNDGRTPLHIAIIAGSLATIDLVTKLTRKEFWDTETVDTLLVAIEIGGFSLEVMSRVLQRMTTLLPSCRETVLGWVIKHDLAAAVSILVDCRVNLDSRLFEADAVVGRSRKDGDGQRYPALFFALEKSDPALATALVMNGTRLNTFLWLDQMGTPRSGVGRIDAIDIALCRRWTDLALLFRPIQIPDVSNEVIFYVTDLHSSLRWLSCRLSGSVVTDLTCLKHGNLCSLTPQFSKFTHKAFFCLDLDKDGSSLRSASLLEMGPHFLQITISQFLYHMLTDIRFLMDTRKENLCPWRLPPLKNPHDQSTAAVISTDAWRSQLSFNEKPYNIQRITI
ncbi:hypothetical protein AUEXF2481DRAFT_607909 [Aureobasidium subglaciale EXF-2481]|uniref:Uncharacterized protein n=1 Tax=Aureobasidium subglaciale (strain EXF-2481) TaxID=1043005 RepID=A0A074XX79_AURSE|nr:uncharacterized protein AUEXF2481DRAFT_607909 [Aureobasidium subglaciale EXF-2481]KEQ90168.1 hypothetical protein AUEXF2481DRAFT_607909 [Aureobasidium subglaciale EXF-2481]